MIEKLKNAAYRLAADISHPEEPTQALIDSCQESIDSLSRELVDVNNPDVDVTSSVHNAVNLVYGTVSPPSLKHELALIINHSINCALQAQDKSNQAADHIYLSGPMTGIKEFNRPRFNHVAVMLRERGWKIINPAEGHEQKCWRDYLTRDITDMMTKCYALCQLEGCENSKGAQLEYHIAKELGWDIYAVCDLFELDPNYDCDLDIAIKKGTEAWDGVPDSWFEDLRG